MSSPPFTESHLKLFRTFIVGLFTDSDQEFKTARSVLKQSKHLPKEKKNNSFRLEKCPLHHLYSHLKVLEAFTADLFTGSKQQFKIPSWISSQSIHVLKKKNFPLEMSSPPFTHSHLKLLEVFTWVYLQTPINNLKSQGLFLFF